MNITDEELNKKTSNLPRLIHTVWAGGKKPLPGDGFTILAKWALYNPKFTMVLWIDTKQPPQNISELKLIYQEQYIKEFTKLFKAKYGKEPDKTPNFEVRDIREESICQTHGDLVDYFLDRIMPNFGMSSDLLRYRILNKYGGIYYDATDVGINEAEGILEELPVMWDDNNPHTIFIEHLSQVTKLPDQIPDFIIPEIGELPGSELEAELTKVKIGNDSFICTSSNPLMSKIISLAESGFKLNSFTDMVHMAYLAHNIHDFTIEKTGPLIPKKIIQLNAFGPLVRGFGGVYKKQISDEIVLLRPLRCLSYQVTNPLKNTRNWTNVSLDIDVIQSKEIAFDKLNKVICYELENMYILRLDDHLNDLKHVAIALKLDYDLLCKDFIMYLERSDIRFDALKVAQNITNNSLIVNFYDSKNLSRCDHLKNVTDINEAFLLYQHITSFAIFTQQPLFTTLLGKLDATIINRHLTHGEQLAIFDKMLYAVNFLYYIKKIQ